MSEWYKLKKDRSFWTLLILLTISSLAYSLLVLFDEGIATMKVIDFYQHTILPGNNYVIRLVPCILAGFFISNEYAIGTMKSIVASGNSRVRIYFAKLIVYSVGAILISMVFPIIFTGIISVLMHFNGMPGIGYFAATIGLTVLYASAFAAMMALFATIFTDSGKAIAFMLIFFTIFDILLYGLVRFLPMFELALDYSVFTLLLDIVNINDHNSGEIVKIILVPVVTFIIFGMIGSILFQKKEIK